jgi:DNA helicase-2/ATP-dependent DNA helicase PcrA
MSPDLNPNQKKAVLAPDAPLLIVAGAGTGKTKTLTNRLAHLVSTGIRPEKICALTFTNKAAREMESRVANGTNEVTGDRLQVAAHSGERRDIFRAPGPFLGTFHSFGARILRREARHLGRTPAFSIFDADDSFRLLKKVLKVLGVDKEDASPADVLHKISSMKSGMADELSLRESPRAANRIALEAFDQYEAALREQNAFDFDDLIDKVVVLFNEHPGVLSRYEQRFSHFLVDEYQDLNNRQYDLVRLLAGHGKKISVVGDDQQTIYSWRGSNFEIFLNFERDWPGATTIVLDQNYRSTSAIIEAAAAVIQNNKNRSASWRTKKLWTENPAGSPVRLIETLDEEQEGEWIAEQLTARSAQPAGEASESTAILYRTNAQSRPIEQALIERNIPYRIYGGLKFYERREIKDLVAALRLAANPKDDVSRERLEKAFTKAAFRALTSELASTEKRRPTELLSGVITSTNYAEYVKKNLTNPEERMENIAELVRFASEFEGLPQLLERLALVQATDDEVRGERLEVRDTGTPVALMTIHLAKGLEFDRVFVAGCVEGLLPHGRSLQSDAELEEERRLMYVAMTRARKELALSFYGIPSRFLSELPTEKVAFKSLVSDGETFSDNEERYITLD